MINIATVQSGAFKILINGISKIINKGKLIFTEEHIKMLETDKGKDILIHLKLYSENFEEYFVKEKKEIKFIIQDDFGLDPKVCYCAKILLDDELLAKSKAKSKKKAEEKAAKIATRILKIAPKPIHAYNGK